MPLTKTAAALIVLTLVSAFPARAQISINISNPNDMVFSSSQNQLYITTDGGTIQRYDLGNQALLSPFSVGGILNGADITTDGNFLYVTQGIAGPTQGILEKVDLSTGMKTDLFYALASNEGGGWDVAIGSNGLALMTTKFNGSGWTPLRQIDLTTGTISVRSDTPGSGSGNQVRGSTFLDRSFDRELVYIQEWNSSAGPAFTYSATSNTFSSAVQFNVFQSQGAVSRDHSLLATLTYPNTTITLNDFTPVTGFANYHSGIAFDPVRDLLYLVNTNQNTIDAFDTHTWQLIQSIAIGQSIASSSDYFGAGYLVASEDGDWLALNLGDKVNLYSVPETASLTYLLIGLAGLLPTVLRQARVSHRGPRSEKTEK